MKLTKRSRRIARKLVLPALAVAMMTTMMYIGSGHRRLAPSSASPTAAAAARTAHGVHHR